MDSNLIKDHWKEWANTYNTDLRATTKTPTIKKLEIRSLYNSIKANFSEKSDIEVLEVGCGNGYNCTSLARLLPNFEFTGVDFIPEMVKHAKEIINDEPEIQNRVKFYTGDILNLKGTSELKEEYDIVFTDRCIINLPTPDLQFNGIDELIKKVKSGGMLLILENFIQLRNKQDELRTAVNLAPRPVPEFNLFLNDKNVTDHILVNNFKLQQVSNFGSLHDIILYVLTPLINNGKVDYDNPMVTAATELCLSLPSNYENSFGEFGQNRLLSFVKG